ncbi:hypothetical protein Tco_0303867 [Tanacetum coccineum]
MLGKREKVIACTSRQLKVLKKDCMTNVMLYRGVGRRSEAKNEFEIDVRRSDLGLLLQPELPEYKWGRITKDIVVKLPSVSTGYDAIRV